MKIHNLFPTNQVRQTEQGRPAEAGKAGAAEPARQGKGVSQNNMDIDVARVQEIQQAIRDGKLEIQADKIADGLIGNIRSMLEDSGK